MLDCNANTNHNNTHTGGKQIYKSVLNCIITQICGTRSLSRIGYWMDSNNKSKPDDNQLIFDLSSLQWLFWGNWSGLDRKSGNISSVCYMLHKIWFTLQIRNIFCTNTNPGSYKYVSGCATNRSIVSRPRLTTGDRRGDSWLLDGILLTNYSWSTHPTRHLTFSRWKRELQQKCSNAYNSITFSKREINLLLLNHSLKRSSFCTLS